MIVALTSINRIVLEGEIHYFSVGNFLMITLFLTGVVAMIMLQTLHKWVLGACTWAVQQSTLDIMFVALTYQSDECWSRGPNALLRRRQHWSRGPNTLRQRRQFPRDHALSDGHCCHDHAVNPVQVGPSMRFMYT